MAEFDETIRIEKSSQGGGGQGPGGEFGSDSPGVLPFGGAIGAPTHRFDELILLVIGVKFDSTIIPSNTTAFDEIILLEKSNLIGLASVGNEYGASPPAVLPFGGASTDITAGRFNESIYLFIGRGFDEVIIPSITTAFDEIILLEKSNLVGLTSLGSEYGASPPAELPLGGGSADIRVGKFNEAILLFITHSFDEKILIAVTGAQFEETIYLEKSNLIGLASLGNEYGASPAAVLPFGGASTDITAGRFNESIYFFIGKGFDEVIIPSNTTAFDGIILLEKSNLTTGTGLSDEYGASGMGGMPLGGSSVRATMGRFDESIILDNAGTGVRFDATILLVNSAQFDDKVFLEKSNFGEYGIPSLGGEYGSYSLGITTISGALSTLMAGRFEETIRLVVTCAELDEDILIVKSYRFEEDLYLQKTAPFDEDLLLVISSQFDEKVILSKTWQAEFDESLLAVISVQFDTTVYLQKSRAFDERIFLWGQTSLGFDEIIVLSTPLQFDETIHIIPGNWRTYDEGILLVRTRGFDEVITLRRCEFEERLFTYKSTPVSFDEKLNIESRARFDELIALSRDLTSAYLDEMILLSKYLVAQFDETVYISKIGIPGTGSAVARYDSTILLTKFGFDETISIARGPVAQVGDVIRDPRGRAVGEMVSGVYFTV
jgi:hypothetical protein